MPYKGINGRFTPLLLDNVLGTCASELSITVRFPQGQIRGARIMLDLKLQYSAYQMSKDNCFDPMLIPLAINEKGRDSVIVGITIINPKFALGANIQLVIPPKHVGARVNMALNVMY